MIGRLTTVILFATNIWLGAGTAVANTNTDANADADSGIVVASPNDQRGYHAFELANRLKVLLISDPTTDKSAAALDVHVGNGSDPVDRQGLAHFLEHMLFLGTEKYPRAGEYQEFIRRHGGANNAYTSYEHTNYFFDIDPDYLEPALDRFAEFFVAPLFTAEYVERERGVVHSEYSSRKQSDGRRIWAARKALFNPKHPMSRFAVGSLSTLADRPGKSIRDDLIEFHRRYYSANEMALVVLGREPISKLREWVSARFEAIEDKNQSAVAPGQNLFDAGRLPARLTVKPIKEQRVLSLTFPIPEVRSHYRTKPTALISNLIGHEGSGSLLAVLKRRALAEGLSAGVGVSHPNEATFVVSISLTEAGVAQWREVTGLLFDYIDLVKREGVAEWIYREQRMLAELSFRFQEHRDPGRYVQSLASDLHRYPPAELLQGPYMMEAFEPDLINQFLSSLRPENVLLTIVDQDQPTRSVEHWYGTEYAIDAIDAALIADWSDASIDGELQLPPPNPFLPDVNLLQVAPRSVGTVPQRILDFAGFELWHHQDVSFRVPRANFYMSIRSPIANASPRNSVLTSLYVRAVNDELNAFAYPATLAGLEYSFYRHVRGVTLKISGYSAKQALLLERIVETMRKLSIDTEKFELYRQELIRKLRNHSQDTPYSQTLSEVQRLLMIPD
ncbi:MAG: insulinase family protein, partial [Gammaproteobacteria bacterium]|nr:insulinase family protein [Gammaproteobacteria bacterium]